jgi:hypothetical protein
VEAPAEGAGEEAVNVEELIAEGYQSTSNKYRTVARLPAGKNGIEALREIAPSEYHHIMERIEQECARTYRRLYAEKHGDQLELSIEEFQAFKRAGGKVSW